MNDKQIDLVKQLLIDQSYETNYARSKAFAKINGGSEAAFYQIAAVHKRSRKRNRNNRK